MPTPAAASNLTKTVAPAVRTDINQLTKKVFRTRGGRLGSGMGLLLEALWGYYTTDRLARRADNRLEMAWLVDHSYNDFACLHMDFQWDPQTRAGELFRVEAKSMNMGAEESKAHFDELAHNILTDDLLVVLVWRWTSLDNDNKRCWPCVLDIFVGRALPIAHLRDALHIARGGTFVDRASCPDRCSPDNCTHHGEPLNSNGSRERPSGPKARRRGTATHAANFGGLVRMLKARRGNARAIRQAQLRDTTVGRAYYDFLKANGVSLE